MQVNAGSHPAPLLEERGVWQGSYLGWYRDINRWPQFGTDGQGLMHRVLHKCLQAVFVNLLRAVVGRENLLLDQVVEARPPLARPQAGSGGTVVHHVGDTARMHVGVEGIDGFNDRLVTHLAIGMAIFEQEVDLRHHHRGVETGGLRVEWNIRLDTPGPHAFAYAPHTRAVDLAHWIGF